MISEEIIISAFSPFFGILVSMATNNKSTTSGAIYMYAQSPCYLMEKNLTGILNSPYKWRDNRVKVGKILSILAIL